MSGCAKAGAAATSTPAIAMAIAERNKASALDADRLLQDLLHLGINLAHAIEDALDLLGPDQIGVLAGDALVVGDEILVLLDGMKCLPQIARCLHRRALGQEHATLHLGADVVHQEQRVILCAARLLTEGLLEEIIEGDHPL